jgi:hypothetical protein
MIVKTAATSVNVCALWPLEDNELTELSVKIARWRRRNADTHFHIGQKGVV